MDKIEFNAEQIDFHGTITSKKDVIFNGEAIDFHFKPASTSLINPFWTVPDDSRLAVLYYNEE